MKVTDAATFIEKCRQVHGDKYDYSKTEYTKANSKITVICPEHGEFETIAYNHHCGAKCRRCRHKVQAKRQSLNQQEVITRFKSIFGDRYDYSEFVFDKSHTKSTVICPEHGSWQTTYSRHFHNRSGCPLCFEEIRGQGVRREEAVRTSEYVRKTQKHDTESFIAAASELHNNKYDYSKAAFDGMTQPVRIVCPEHGVFPQLANLHLRGQGCSLCGNRSKANKQSTTLDEFAVKARYCFRLKTPWVGQKTKVVLYCETHGEFTQSALKHLQGQGCPSCRESHGESLIADWLSKQNVTFERQKAFNSLHHRRSLRIDFWLPTKQVAIEFDGLQHKNPVAFFGGIPEFIRCQHRDKLKTDYCKKNRIKLVRIDSVKAIDSTLRRLI